MSAVPTSTLTPEKRVLCVGLVCLDCIIVCDGYPQEDTDQKCIDLLWQRGGNASNSSTALALVGEVTEYLGVITDSMEQKFLAADLEKYEIISDHCVLCIGVQTPSATIISNIRNASRTILAFQRDLPELTMDDFKKIPLHTGLYKWIHFEGRPSADVIKTMLEHVDEYNSHHPDDRIMTSVEIEKTRDNLACLFNMADVVFVSKEYALALDCNSMTETLDKLYCRCRLGSTLICPWGDLGAAARLPDGQTVTSSAYPPPTLVDTLAAGDTFNGATIAALSNGRTVQDAITFGCQVAGAKCGLRGWNGMKERIQEIMKMSP